MPSAYINTFLTTTNVYQIGYSDNTFIYVQQSGCELYLTDNPNVATLVDALNNQYTLDITLIKNPIVSTIAQLVNITPTTVNTPEGPAGGDLSNDYPNPTIIWANGLPYYNSQFVASTRQISTTSPITGGGDLSADRTIEIPKATALVSGYISNTDWGIFNGKEPSISSGTISQYWRGDKTWQSFPAIPSITPSALTKTDDTNVTLTLGGTPNTALLQAVSLTLGWTGVLADSRIESAATWNAKISGKAYDLTTDQTAVTGTTANTYVNSFLIPANTVQVGQIWTLLYRARKTGIVGNMTLRVYANTSAAIGGILICVYQTTAAALGLTMTRNIVIKTATNTEVFNSTNSSNAHEYVNSTVAYSALNIDWTTNKYIVFAIQNSNTGDSTVVSMAEFKTTY